jgi:hypothetical protein
MVQFGQHHFYCPSANTGAKPGARPPSNPDQLGSDLQRAHAFQRAIINLRLV